jgi:hypothetical protein
VSIPTPLFHACVQPAQQACFLSVSFHLSLKNISHSRARPSRAAASCARCCHLPYCAPSVTAPCSSPATLAPAPCTLRPAAACRAPSHARAEVLLECCRHRRSPPEGRGRCRHPGRRDVQPQQGDVAMKAHVASVCSSVTFLRYVAIVSTNVAKADRGCCICCKCFRDKFQV